jgi:hypothetical protein
MDWPRRGMAKAAHKERRGGGRIILGLPMLKGMEEERGLRAY